MLDASRAVGVVASLLDPAQKADFDAKNREDQAQLRTLHGRKRQKPLVPIAAADDGRLKLAWRPEDIATPAFTGRRVIDDVPLAEIAKYIDWTFFFTAWELRGPFPQILDHPQYGEAARDLYGNAQKVLQKIVDGGLLKARGVDGFWPASGEGRDIVLYRDRERQEELCRFNMLRQQQAKGPGDADGEPGGAPGQRPFLALSDFVAPRESGLSDHVGAFAVTAGIGLEEIVRGYEADHDDYHAIIAKALADRLAEAFAELLHQRARRGRAVAVAEPGLRSEGGRGGVTATAGAPAPAALASDRPGGYAAVWDCGFL